MRAETEEPARSEAVAITVSPSTSRTGVNVTSPSVEPSFSTWTRSPSATRSCLPPVLMTAYIDRPCYRTAPPPTEPVSQQTFIHDDAAAVAAGAGGGERLDEAFGDALARHLDQAELGDLEHLGAGLVAGQRPLEGPEHVGPVRRDLHVDEVDDDDAADVAQAQLTGDLLGRLEVVAVDGLLEVRRA